MRNLESYTRDERRDAINQVIINKRDRRVLELRLLDGLSYKEIGADAEVRLEVRQVGNILSRGCALVGDYLENKHKKHFFFF